MLAIAARAAPSAAAPDGVVDGLDASERAARAASARSVSGSSDDASLDACETPFEAPPKSKLASRTDSGATGVAM